MSDYNAIIEFIEKCLTIINQKDTKLYNYQEKILKRLVKEDKMVVLKARQLGITSLFLCYMLYMIIYRQKHTVVMATFNNDTSNSLIRKCKYILDEFGINYTHDRTILQLNNGSSLVINSRKDKDSFRGWKIDFLYVDEYQLFPSAAGDIREHVNKDPLILDFLNICVAKKIVIASIAGKKGSNFHKLWKENKNGLGEFYPIKLKWNANPNADEKHIETQKIYLGKKFFKSEFMCKFVD